MTPSIHACTETRTGILVRTFCGVQVRQKDDRSGWVTMRWNTIPVTNKMAEVTCKRCQEFFKDRTLGLTRT